MSLIAAIARSRMLPFLVLIVAGLGFVALQAPQHQQLSPYDEYVYVDYLAKVPTEGFLRSGEETGNLARNEISCRGVLGYGAFGQGCNVGSHADDAKYPYSGGSGASIYAPPYFAVTWALAQPLIWTGLSLVDAARLVGGAWLAGGLVLLYQLMRMLRVPRWVGVGLNLAVIGLPVTYWSTTYISTDAPILAASAAIGCLAVRVWNGKSAAWFVMVAALGALTKIQIAGAVGIAALALILGAAGIAHAAPAHTRWRSFIRDRRSWLAAGALVAAVAAEAAWLAFSSVERLKGAPAVQVDTTEQPLTISHLINEAFQFLFAVGAPGTERTAMALLTAEVLTVASVVAVAAPFVIRRLNISGQTRVIAVSILVGALALGPMLSLSTWAQVHYYVPLPNRYGLVLLPAFLLSIGLMQKDASRTRTGILLAAGAVSAAAAFFTP